VVGRQRGASRPEPRRGYDGKVQLAGRLAEPADTGPAAVYLVYTFGWMEPLIEFLVQATAPSIYSSSKTIAWLQKRRCLPIEIVPSFLIVVMFSASLLFFYYSLLSCSLRQRIICVLDIV
jgi:hypothetical protein